MTEILLAIIAFLGGFFVFRLNDLKKEVNDEKGKTEELREDVKTSKEIDDEVSKMSPGELDNYLIDSWMRSKDSPKNRSP